MKLGLSGGEMGTSFLLPRIVGPTAAFELLMSGRLFDAAEALRLGLVLEVVADDALLERAFEIAHSFMKNSPIGLAMTKELTWMHLGPTHLRDALTNEMHAQMLCGHTADHHEAVDAYLSKRTPEFRNR